MKKTLDNLVNLNNLDKKPSATKSPKAKTSVAPERTQAGKTLTKFEMMQHLMNELGISKQQSRQFVEQFFGELTNSLVAGHQVKLSGFGNFAIKDKKQRPGRNPKTGEAVAVTARRVVTFKAGQKMRKSIENSLLTG